ncbi:YdeI/OmpD-associated family protein [Cytophagales bacterium LB-30]|uniref:YdeI/OmpD-associated family protein n=1 Tax=Shiella aurantiaca TaxID=3058365 RepID=A0ABT8F2M9_9BACT|nr:YdeI/OmpD-associated family protein [Shiella aurantiaca]MDN4164707.1 YdeI/OmpD-associated family protein [Shiella aurantiaca]
MEEQKKYTFEAPLIGSESGGVYVNFPYDVEKEFGKKGQIKIQASIDGVPYRGSLANMGTGSHILIVLKSIREKIKKKFGDTVSVVLWQDTEERVVIVPEDVQEKLDAHPAERAFFESLSYTHKKEYVHWIEEAKKEETRLRRLDKMIEMLSDKKKGI